MIDKRGKAYQEFGGFVSGLVGDLNSLSAEGWCVLVEGKRDARALRMLGYSGSITTVSSAGRHMEDALKGSAGVVILTDLDREGGVLASRCVRRLKHAGFDVSLAERRRLKAASKGVFLHIENLSRFAEPDFV